MGAIVTALLTVLLPHKLGWQPPRSLAVWKDHTDFPLEEWKAEEFDWERLDSESSDPPTPNWLRRVRTADDSISWGL